MALYEMGANMAEVGGPDFNARLAMRAIDEIITEVYLPFRGASGYGTERAILVAPPHAPHRENDAEHSWHVGFTALVFYDMRQELGLNLPAGFDVDGAVTATNIHDVPEIPSEDVDAMTPNTSLLELKNGREHAAFKYFVEKHPIFEGVMRRWQEYERKDTPETRFVSDLDKIVATRMIYLDGGTKWHGWEGYQTSREDMSTRIRAKLLTDMGHQLFDVLEADIDANPGVFPYLEARDRDCQLAFDLQSLT